MNPYSDGREDQIRTLSRGDYFGEQALLKTDLRTANVVADSDDVECLSLDREHFFQARYDIMRSIGLRAILKSLLEFPRRGRFV